MKSHLIIKLAKLEARKIPAKVLRSEIEKIIRNCGDTLELLVYSDALEHKIGIKDADEFMDKIYESL